MNLDEVPCQLGPLGDGYDSDSSAEGFQAQMQQQEAVPTPPVEVTRRIGGPSKPQIPWRDTAKSPLLFEVLMALLIVEGTHLATPKAAAWDAFTLKVFEQPAFSGFEPVGSKQIRNQVEGYISKRAHHFGWKNSAGKTCNLSGHTGGLSRTDENIKQIFIQLENKENLKALKKMDGQQLEKDENAVIMEGITKNAEDKRKRLDDDKKAPASASSMTAPPADDGEPASKKTSPAPKGPIFESPLDKKLYERLQKKPADEKAVEDGVTVDPAKGSMLSKFAELEQPIP